jgi:hypothetical protein
VTDPTVVTKYLRETIQGRKDFILAHSFRGLNPVTYLYALGQNIMVVGRCGGGVSSLHGGQEAEKKAEARDPVQTSSNTPSHPLPSSTFQNLPKQRHLVGT